ncbi:MAG: hypothetical protein M3Q23_12830 [Actinomycetota bacterium]|nr:hypothetical protein [Actinomycetota bacterium]
MVRFRILLVVVLAAASLASVLAPSASAAPKEILVLETVPHSVGQYSVDLSLYHPASKFVSLGVIFGRGTSRATQDHEFLFVLGRKTFTASDDLAAGTLDTGELVTTPGQRPDYGSIDMGFEASGPLQSRSVPCAGAERATFSERTGSLTGTLDFNTNSGLGVVDVPALQAALGRFTLPAGCGPGALNGLFGLQAGSTEPSCEEGLFLVGGTNTRDGRFAELVGFKFSHLGQSFALIVVDEMEPIDVTAPAIVFHDVTAFGPPGMIAADRLLDHARVRGRPGKPFMGGHMDFHRTKPLEEHHRTTCRTTDSDGTWNGRMVARFDIGGHLVLRSLQGSVSRSTKAGHHRGAEGQALRSLAERALEHPPGAFPAASVAWRALAASL